MRIRDSILKSFIFTGSGAETHGKINEKFVECVTDVKLWEAGHKEETTPRLGPRLNGRGLLGQPKQIIKTLLGQGDPANFTVDNIRNNGYGDTLEKNGQEVLANPLR